MEAEQNLQGLKAQLQLLVETHGTDADRSSKLSKLQTAKNDAEVLLAATRMALEEMQPDMLEQDQSRFQRALENSRSLKGAAESKLAVARNILTSDGAIDPQEAVARADAGMQAAKERRMSIERQAESVKLLHGLFCAEQKNLAEQFTRPFAEKITGYLQCLFGVNVSSSVTLENNVFSGLQLFRPEQGQGAFSFKDLSSGAREQLSAAVRLAMAEVLAENFDNCLPLVFDDAFANSDSNRILHLQRMLDRASRQGLQIIVLSCNPSDYVTLGAATVKLNAEPATPVLASHKSDGALSQEKSDRSSGDVSDLSGLVATSSQKEALLHALQLKGGSMGNGSLRQLLGWDEETYNTVKNELVASKHLIPGRGRGGSVTLDSHLADSH